MLKTYSPKASEITRQWYLIDASGQKLGRLASVVATYLQGKHKPTYAPHLDSGDYVVVINTAGIAVSGNKLEGKLYYRHSGYPGGIKSINLAEQLAKDPNRVVQLAVKGMLPKNRLQGDRLARLKLAATSEHPHSGQQPVKLELKQISKRGGK